MIFWLNFFTALCLFFSAGISAYRSDWGNAFGLISGGIAWLVIAAGEN